MATSEPISSLPAAAVPLRGNEIVLMNQGTTTCTTPVSSIARLANSTAITVVSGTLPTPTLVQGSYGYYDSGSTTAMLENPATKDNLLVLYSAFCGSTPIPPEFSSIFTKDCTSDNNLGLQVATKTAKGGETAIVCPTQNEMIFPYINGVCYSTGSEFGYDTIPYQAKRATDTSYSSVNVNTTSNITDSMFSLNSLEATVPTNQTVSLVVSWFGNNLDASQCQIYPATTYPNGSFQMWNGSAWVNDDWRVSGLTQSSPQTRTPSLIGGGTLIANPTWINISDVVGGGLPTQTGYAALTLVNDAGETLPCPATYFSMATNNLLYVIAPNPTSVPNATAYNVYVGPTSATMTLQNSSPVELGTLTSNWTEPTTGFTTADKAPPTVNTSSGPGNYSFSGTPSDQSVVRCIQNLKARGYKVVLYPFIMMDTSTKPWRGQITYADDISTAGNNAVSSFLGTCNVSDFTLDTTNLTVNYTGALDNYCFRRLILHYAHLCVLAGGVDLFLLGSEMAGMEAIRGRTWTPQGVTGTDGTVTWDNPFVQGIIQLASDVRGIFDAAGLTKTSGKNLITYGADCTTYRGYAGWTTPYANGIYPHLDELWADDNIDFVAFDNYLPMGDWQNGTGHLDYVNWANPKPTTWPPSPSQMNNMGLPTTGNRTINSLDYLKYQIEGGNGYHWVYYDEPNGVVGIDPHDPGQYVTVPLNWSQRYSQTRYQFYNGQQLFARKMLRWWWLNSHQAVYDDGDGSGFAPHGSHTQWVPESKSVIFTEYGFPSLDKGANQPNVFYDPTSSVGATPYWSDWNSTGTLPIVDNGMQSLALQAMYEYWNDNNQISSTGIQMVATQWNCVWTWDARPYPAFPLNAAIWGDAYRYPYGDWFEGKLSTNGNYGGYGAIRVEEWSNAGGISVFTTANPAPPFTLSITGLTAGMPLIAAQETYSATAPNGTVAGWAEYCSATNIGAGGQLDIYETTSTSASGSYSFTSTGTSNPTVNGAYCLFQIDGNPAAILPPPSSTYRGQLLLIEATGGSDNLYICLNTPSGYIWKQL